MDFIACQKTGILLVNVDVFYKKDFINTGIYVQYIATNWSSKQDGAINVTNLIPCNYKMQKSKYGMHIPLTLSEKQCVEDWLLKKELQDYYDIAFRWESWLQQTPYGKTLFSNLTKPTLTQKTI